MGAAGGVAKLKLPQPFPETAPRPPRRARAPGRGRSKSWAPRRRATPAAPPVRPRRAAAGPRRANQNPPTHPPYPAIWSARHRCAGAPPWARDRRPRRATPSRARLEDPSPVCVWVCVCVCVCGEPPPPHRRPPPRGKSRQLPPPTAPSATRAGSRAALASRRIGTRVRHRAHAAERRAFALALTGARTVAAHARARTAPLCWGRFDPRGSNDLGGTWRKIQEEE